MDKVLVITKKYTNESFPKDHTKSVLSLCEALSPRLILAQKDDKFNFKKIRKDWIKSQLRGKKWWK